MAALFVAYVATARLGLKFDALSGVATTIWPPSGIALAALFRFGLGAWPWITVAAFLVNLGAGAPLLAVFIIALGNTLEAVVGASLLRRLGFRPQLERLRDVFVLVGAAAIGSTVVSASFGTAAVAITSGMPAGGYTFFWSTWWIGDLMGDLLVGSLLFTWTADLRLGRNTRRIVEAGSLLAVLALAGVASCGVLFEGRLSEMLRGTYVIWPFLIWAALRFGPRGTAAALAVVAGVMVGCTAAGEGPFVRATPHESLRLLQSYLAVTSATILTLAAALAERRRAITARDDFLSIASHELRTPLTALKLRLDTATRLFDLDVRGGAPPARELFEPDKALSPPEVVRLGQVVAASARHVARLERLVDDLLDMSRLRADRLTLALDRLSLTELLRETTARLGEELARAGSSLELDLPDEAMGMCDRSRIEQVVTNLVTNAIKYAPGKPVRVCLRAEGGRARITVRDQGPGIARSEQRRIFEPYRRLASARHLGGLGLGLYIGRQIAEAHGGSLTVESEPGAGARFILELPIEVAPERA
jgi:signal transduction histidine kinase